MKQQFRIPSASARGEVNHPEPVYFAPMERWIENGDLDFVQVRYSIAQRAAEERILPAAAKQCEENYPIEQCAIAW
ncbi:hypothetical protein [Chroococcidiopsis sp. CCNUC1]|uniref:hypothetical protein n=1 Tax=Chroococcidiopsis sp. CCNUC1 TaxID=2653189 RepID=UPI0020216221|nr:hypothetical protein [Chroococcidiopsis sp. CCNUC1]URD52631.1 hypothetical protein M5J74_11675 [Chroococcidiopsis sp. CCNUC1]